MENKNNKMSSYENETSISNAVTGLLTKTSVEYEVVSSSFIGTTIIATLPGKQKGKSIGVIAYLNTVSESAEDINNTYAAIQSITDLKNEAVTIKLMIFIAEDTSIASRGLWKLATLGYACDLDALVIINPVQETHGLLSLEFKTEGSSVHGSVPQLGVNAINHMRLFLKKLDDYLASGESKEEGGAYHILEYLEGGSAPNTIPDGCQAIVNIYTLPSQSHPEILKGIEDINIQLQEEERRFSLTVNILENTQGGIDVAKLGPLSDRLPVVLCTGKETTEEYQSVINNLLA